MADYKPYNLLYIHGYNTSFNDAITQGAQFGIDLKIPGRTFVFSWPSAGIYRGYQADEATVEVSLPALREYLGLILESTGEMPLNVVVHSMGNRAAIRLLESVARREIDTNRIQHVVFAAPDVDTQLFLQVSNKFAGAFKSATLYGTTGDWALQWSEFLHGGYPRAGLFPPVTLGEHFDTILVEGFDLANLGHGYYAEADRVLHDIYHLMLYGARPNERRCTVERIDSQTGRTYWALPLG
jgi:esterase/lipase superfamily enzyme